MKLLNYQPNLLRNKITKYILKNLLSEFIPKSIVSRPKMDVFQLKRWMSNKKFRKLWTIYLMSQVENLDGIKKNIKKMVRL